MLQQKVKPAIRRKHQDSLWKGVNLLYDNAISYTGQKTRETIEKLSWEVLPHPFYSPDVPPSSFYPFDPLKAFLRVTKFEDSQAVKKAPFTIYIEE